MFHDRVAVAGIAVGLMAGWAVAAVGSPSTSPPPGEVRHLENDVTDEIASFPARDGDVLWRAKVRSREMVLSTGAERDRGNAKTRRRMKKSALVAPKLASGGDSGESGPVVAESTVDSDAPVETVGSNTLSGSTGGTGGSTGGTGGSTGGTGGSTGGTGGSTGGTGGSGGTGDGSDGDGGGGDTGGTDDDGSGGTVGGRWGRRLASSMPDLRWRNDPLCRECVWSRKRHQRLSAVDSG